MAKTVLSLLSGVVSSVDQSSFSLCSDRGFGVRDGSRVVFSLFEAYFLFKEGKVVILDFSGRELSSVVLLRKFSRLDKRFSLHYTVFCDLRRKGFVVKSGLKFGSLFRVYDSLKSFKSGHSSWLLFVVSDRERFSWHDLSSRVRVSHSTKKDLLVSVVDSEGAVSYFVSSWFRP